MKKIRQLAPFVLIVCYAAVIRLIYLTSWPPTNPNFYSLRVITAIISIITVVLMMLIVHKLRHQPIFTFLSGLIMAITPWHIEQSRVFSPAMWALVIILTGTLLLIYVKPIIYRVVIVVVTFFGTMYVFPQVSEVFIKHDFPTLFEYLQNWFKLISIEFLFYKNDSFWYGGLRTQGAFLFSTIPVFLIGLFELAKNINTSYIKYMALFVIILSVSAAAPKFPEQQIFFLTIPFFVYVFALGAHGMISSLKRAKPVFKLIMFICFLLIAYDYVLFVHFYTIHYTNRVKNEMPLENIKF